MQPCGMGVERESVGKRTGDGLLSFVPDGRYARVDCAYLIMVISCLSIGGWRAWSQEATGFVESLVRMQPALDAEPQNDWHETTQPVSLFYLLTLLL
jgi:hypothetical protein